MQNNLTDGLDGLATGLSGYWFAMYAIMAYFKVQHLSDCSVLL